MTPPARPGPVPPRTTLPSRGVPAPAPAPIAVPARPDPRVVGNGLSRTTAEIGPSKRLHLIGQGTAALDALERDIQDVVENLKAATAEESDVLLIIDQPDLLLAATGPNRGIGATEMGEWILGLQEVCCLLSLGSAFRVLRMRWRLLVFTCDNCWRLRRFAADTQWLRVCAPADDSARERTCRVRCRIGASGSDGRAASKLGNRRARDVSGVLRASKGGAWSDDGSRDLESKWEEKEVLYFVHRDGSVHVFGRGE